MIDRYRHLNADDGVMVGIETVAAQVVGLNYGVHRLLSAIVRHRRADNVAKYERERKAWLLEDELADELEALLNKGLF